MLVQTALQLHCCAGDVGEPSDPGIGNFSDLGAGNPGAGEAPPSLTLATLGQEPTAPPSPTLATLGQEPMAHPDSLAMTIQDMASYVQSLERQGHSFFENEPDDDDDLESASVASLSVCASAPQPLSRADPGPTQLARPHY